MTVRQAFTKGIIQSSCVGTRLHPVASEGGRCLLPVYDKPLIYYSLAVLVSVGIRDVLVICQPDEIDGLERLLGTGAQFGIRIQYTVDAHPAGTTSAFLLGEDFIAGDNVALIFADTFLYGTQFDLAALRAAARRKGATLFAKSMVDPRCHGVVEFDSAGKPVAILDRPYITQSKWAITGFYFYDDRVCEIAAGLSSAHGCSVDILTLNRVYLEIGQLHVERLSGNTKWYELNTFDALMAAAVFVDMVQAEHGHKIGCIEEAAFRQGFVNADQLLTLSQRCSNGYGRYLQRLALNTLSPDFDSA